jgi:transcriptional regulator with XRE-family HTH domain
MTWNEKLKFARKVSRLTLRAVENATGISNAYLSQLENGQIKDPSFFKMMKLLQFYNLEPQDFIESEKEKWRMIINTQSSTVTCAACGTSHLLGTMCHNCFGRK